MKKSDAYKIFLAQQQEILKHKWIESEKRGQDIGFKMALCDWVSKHRKQWLLSKYSNQQSQHELQ